MVSCVIQFHLQDQEYWNDHIQHKSKAFSSGCDGFSIEKQCTHDICLPDMTSRRVLVPKLLSPGHELKNPIFWHVCLKIYLEVFIRLEQAIYRSTPFNFGNF